jgi:hypothetical protein
MPLLAAFAGGSGRWLAAAHRRSTAGVGIGRPTGCWVGLVDRVTPGSFTRTSSWPRASAQPLSSRRVHAVGGRAGPVSSSWGAPRSVLVLSARSVGNRPRRMQVLLPKGRLRSQREAR